MTFSARDFLPTPSNWFDFNVEYEGWGRAEFYDPEGSLEGPVSVSFDELGEASIEMNPDVRTLRSSRALRFGLDEFLSGEQPQRAGDHYVLTRTLASRNLCTKLEIETPAGIFRTDDIVNYYSDSFYGFSAQENVRKITFNLWRARFDAAAAGQPKYWVIPLSNFVPEWRRSAPEELARTFSPF